MLYIMGKSIKKEHIETLEEKTKKQKDTEIEILTDKIEEISPSSSSSSSDEGGNNLEIPKKEKKPRTEKQIEAFKIACQKRQQQRDKRKIEKHQKEEQIKQQIKAKEEQIKNETEEKIIKKAISIKKKQIIKEAVLDEISDDDIDTIPIELVKKIALKTKTKKIQKEMEKPIFIEKMVEKPRFISV